MTCLKLLKFCGHHALKDSKAGRSPAGALGGKSISYLATHAEAERERETEREWLCKNYKRAGRTFEVSSPRPEKRSHFDVRINTKINVKAVKKMH